MRVRYRVDGMLHDATTVPRRMVAGVISRLKIMASLDIAEKRLPQDGRVGLTVGGHPIDIRMASLPSVKGEKIVLRHPRQGAGADRRSTSSACRTTRSQRFQDGFTRAYGATFVTGPTGSGKTTSLYAALNMINTPEKNIITIEDPVEYQLPGLTQVQVNLKAGLTFAAGLRSIVRSDPDVIMVGEIRDKETAQIAIESALTGHLVLSTLHTNDAPTAITRLTEMGIEPFLTASALDCVVSQRLARLLCTHCKERVVIRPTRCASYGIDAPTSRPTQPKGCKRCSYSGYKGRVGLYEAMRVTEEIRELAIERASADEIRDVAIEQGMRTLAAGRPRQGPHGHHHDRGSGKSNGFRDGCRLRRTDMEDRFRRRSSKEVVELDASDLHMTVGAPPMVRVRGELQRARDYPRADLEGHPRHRLQDPLATTSASGSRRSGRSTSRTRCRRYGRFRVNAYMQRASIGAAFRLIPSEIKSIEQLGLPAVIHEFVKKPRGFVLVTGRPVPASRRRWRR